jgi:hypothetical protein
METLEFYDLKAKKKFKTDKYKVVTMKNGRKAAKTVSPSGSNSFRFLPNK